MVTRLSGTDALSLHTQSPKTPAHTLTFVIIDASDQLSHQRLHQLLAASLPQLARFRSRLVAKPLGVGQPVWGEIDDYDPSSQIHRATVRAPGGRSEFADLIAILSARIQDCPSRLWEAWSIDGLAGGRWALAVKMSPELGDGAAGTASLWPRLLTAEPHASPANNLPTEPSLGSTPSAGDLITDAMTEIVENQVAGMWLVAETVSGVLQAVSGRLLRRRIGDPVQILANLHTATERLNAIRSRTIDNCSPTVDLATIASIAPPTLARLGMQLYTRSGLRRQLEPICHGSVSYGAGEPVPAYCAGAKVIGMHTVAPLAEGGGLSIALTSRGGELDVSVCACPDNVPAVDDIATGIMQSVHILAATAQESPRGQGRSVVTEMTSHPANRSRGQPTIRASRTSRRRTRSTPRSRGR